MTARAIIFWPLYISIPVVFYFLGSLQKSNFSFLILGAAGMYLFMTAHLLRYMAPEKMKNLWWILALYILSSVFLVFRYPLLSDDIERYAWEGYVQTMGYNPYMTAPNDPVFEKETLNKLVNHPHMPAVYPPFIQIVFRLLSYISTSVYFFKIFFVLVSLGFIAFLYHKKKYFEESFYLAAVFPFLAIETAWSGHLDVAAIFLLAAALYYLPRPVLSGLLLGLSAMTKIIPVIFYPVFVKSLGSFRERIIFTGSFLAPFLLYLPFIKVKGSLFYSLEKYANEWVFSGFFYTILKTAGLGGEKLRVFLGIVFVIVYLAVYFKVKGVKENIYLTLLALMLLSPVVHPWYLLWLIPFSGKKYFYGASAILLASFGMYEVLGDWFAKGQWAEKPAVVISGYLTALAVFYLSSIFVKDS